VNIIRFPIWILLAAFVGVAGCSIKTPDPLAGWSFCFSQDPAKLDQAIQADYHVYIEKLPSEEKKFASYAHDFEDGTGRHAITLIVNLNGTEWTHILIYDNNNKRIKAIKYVSGHYRS
jgi:hypothetical protein